MEATRYTRRLRSEQGRAGPPASRAGTLSKNRARLLHIRDAISQIRGCTTPREEFLADRRTQNAVIRNLEIIGEEALAGLEEARKAWIDAARGAGKPIPEPRYRPLIYQTR